MCFEDSPNSVIWDIGPDHEGTAPGEYNNVIKNHGTSGIAGDIVLTDNHN